MVLNTRAIGKKISSMEKAKRPGLMDLIMRETSFRERKTEKEYSDGRTAPSLMESFQITTYTDKAFISGLTNVSSMVIGKITKCTVKACLHGLMDESTKVNILRTRNKAMVYLPGLTVENTMENGSIISNMAKEST
jgi:hypothetical protein